MPEYRWEPTPFDALGDRLVIEPNCSRCPALAAARTRIAWGVGVRDPTLLVVGEAPAAGDPPPDRHAKPDRPDGPVSDGPSNASSDTVPDTSEASNELAADTSEASSGFETDDPWRGGNHTGCAYTSRHSGRRIRETVAALGYADDAFYTNAVSCFPAEGVAAETDGLTAQPPSDPHDDPTNREPTPTERATCRCHLLREIAILEPSVVVTTGRHATESVLEPTDRTLDGFVDRVGDRIPLPALGVACVPALHPSYRDVWLSRLELSESAYYDRLRSAIDA